MDCLICMGLWVPLSYTWRGRGFLHPYREGHVIFITNDSKSYCSLLSIVTPRRESKCSIVVNLVRMFYTEITVKIQLGRQTEACSIV